MGIISPKSIFTISIGLLLPSLFVSAVDLRDVSYRAAVDELFRDCCVAHGIKGALLRKCSFADLHRKEELGPIPTAGSHAESLAYHRCLFIDGSTDVRGCCESRGILQDHPCQEAMCTPETLRLMSDGTGGDEGSLVDKAASDEAHCNQFLRRGGPSSKVNASSGSYPLWTESTNKVRRIADSCWRDTHGLRLFTHGSVLVANGSTTAVLGEAVK